MTQLPLSTAIYQLRLVLAGISPMIWRRLLVSSETTIAQLHQYIQVALDWSGEHWHRFRIHGKDYGIAFLGSISFEDNPHAVPLSRFRLHPRESFRYEYDFIANWRVNIGVLSTSNRKPPLRLAPMIQIAKIVADLRAEGHPIEDETLMHVTPLMRKHINPFGRYHFDLGRMPPDLDRSSAASA